MCIPCRSCRVLALVIMLAIAPRLSGAVDGVTIIDDQSQLENARAIAVATHEARDAARIDALLTAPADAIGLDVRTLNDQIALIERHRESVVPRLMPRATRNATDSVRAWIYLRLLDEAVMEPMLQRGVAAIVARSDDQATALRFRTAVDVWTLLQVLDARGAFATERLTIRSILLMLLSHDDLARSDLRASIMQSLREMTGRSTRTSPEHITDPDESLKLAERMFRSHVQFNADDIRGALRSLAHWARSADPAVVDRATSLFVANQNLTDRLSRAERSVLMADMMRHGSEAMLPLVRRQMNVGLVSPRFDPRPAALEAIGRLAGPASIDELIARLDQEPFRIAALAGLAHAARGSERDDVIDRVAATTTDPATDEATRTAAARALAHIGGDRAVEELVVLQPRLPWWSRYEVQWILAGRSLNGARSELIERGILECPESSDPVDHPHWPRAWLDTIANCRSTVQFANTQSPDDVESMIRTLGACAGPDFTPEATLARAAGGVINIQFIHNDVLVRATVPAIDRQAQLDALQRAVNATLEHTSSDRRFVRLANEPAVTLLFGDLNDIRKAYHDGLLPADQTADPDGRLPARDVLFTPSS